MLKSRGILVLLLAASAVLAFTRSSHAISAFSRQYNVECSTCHDPFPHRTEFGEAFLRNGYVWPGAAPAPQKPEGLKESYWVAGLTDSIPLSLSLRHDLSYDDDKEQDKLSPDTRFQIHVGGNIRQVVGFFAHDLTADKTEAFGVLRLKELIDLPVNVRYGRIIPQTSIWKPNQNYMINPLATQTLSVSGEPALGAVRDGMELDATILGKVYAAVGVADRQDQNPMDYYGHLAVKIGGTNYAGEEPHVDFDNESVWDFMSLTIGAYGYKGWTRALDNDYYRVGGDAELRYHSFTLMGSYLFARDSKDPDEQEVDSVVITGEIDYLHMSKYLIGLRYERQDQGNSPDGVVNAVTGSLGWMPLQNFWVRLEGKWSKSNAEEDDEKTVGNLFLSYHL